MKKADAIEHFGGEVPLAKALGITPEAIYQWKERVPRGRAFQIEILTNGVLKANPEQAAA